MDILSVQNLSKHYDKFTLKKVSFSLEKGYIMGFIGRNGAGKTTTLKAMLNLVHADGGQVTMLGQDFASHELACKHKIGFVFGGVDYYPKKKLKAITSVVRRFYPDWDNDVYTDYLRRFALDPEKRVDELSDGMRVKYALALALSHHAQLLILDEPTSGLDPVSRDDLLELFQSLIEDGERSILFSTHITSDLEKCADFITYIRDGEIVASTDLTAFLDSWRLVKGSVDRLPPELKPKMHGLKQNAFGFAALMSTADVPADCALDVAPADLDTIMIYCERE